MVGKMRNCPIHSFIRIKADESTNCHQIICEKDDNERQQINGTEYSGDSLDHSSTIIGQKQMENNNFLPTEAVEQFLMGMGENEKEFDGQQYKGMLICTDEMAMAKNGFNEG
jgi:hypothetical protein